MKNKHTLANKRQHYISKTERETLNNMDIVTDVEKTNMPKVYTKWWQKLLNCITFGLYKPTTFWYKIKPVKK